MGDSNGRRRGAQMLEANERFLRSVTSLLGDVDSASQLSEKARERARRLRESLEEQQEVMLPRLQRALEKLDEQQKGAQARAAKVITGREDLSIDDWLQKYKVVKTLDKVTYVGGVAFMLLTQYVAIRAPELFRIYFAANVLLLVGMRAWMYTRDRMQYFLLDYCYVINTMSAVNAVFLPHNAFMWQLTFVAANGPLMWAIVAWRNSLVFHDLDKVTSIYIHFVPSLLSYAVRWNVHPSPMCPGGDEAHCGLSFATAFAVPLAIYLAWQLAYLVITEVLEKPRFDADPTLMTSLRWIVRDKRNSTHQIMLQLGRRIGVLRRGEELNLQTSPLKPIGLFVGLQLAFTVATFVPTALLFRVQFLHRLFIVLVGGVALWNGAGFMFHVFVVRYEESLQRKAAEARGTKAGTRRSQRAVADAADAAAGGEGVRRRSSKRESRREGKRDSKRGSRRISDADATEGGGGSVSKINKGFCALPNERERALLATEREAAAAAADPVAGASDDDDDDVAMQRLPSI